MKEGRKKEEKNQGIRARYRRKEGRRKEASTETGYTRRSEGENEGLAEGSRRQLE